MVFTGTQKGCVAFPLLVQLLENTENILFSLADQHFFLQTRGSNYEQKIPLGVKILLGASPVRFGWLQRRLGWVPEPLQNTRMYKNSVTFAAGWKGTQRGALAAWGSGFAACTAQHSPSPAGGHSQPCASATCRGEKCSPGSLPHSSSCGIS